MEAAVLSYHDQVENPPYYPTDISKIVVWMDLCSGLTRRKLLEEKPTTVLQKLLDVAERLADIWRGMKDLRGVRTRYSY